MRAHRSLAGFVAALLLLGILAPLAGVNPPSPLLSASSLVLAQEEIEEENGVGLDEFEPDNAPDAASELALDGVPQARSLYPPGDRDWATFNAAAGDRVRIETTGRCDTLLFLYAPDAASVLRRDDDSGEGLNAAVEYAVGQAGDYYVQVRMFESSRRCEAYELVGSLLGPLPVDTYEPDDSPAQAKPLGLDGTLQGRTIHASRNSDWFSLRLDTGKRVSVFTGGVCDTLLALYAPDGTTLLAEDDDSGGLLNAEIDYAVGETGTYFGVVTLFEEAETCDFYQLGARLLPPIAADAYEPDDAFDRARPLALDGLPQQRSFHSSRDADWVSFGLQAGERLFLFTAGRCDTLLTLYRPDGRTPLRRDDDGGEGLNAAILYTAEAAGTYYVAVQPFSASRGACESYLLYGARFTGGLTPTVTPTTGTPRPATPTPRRTAAPTATPRPTATSTPQPGSGG